MNRDIAQGQWKRMKGVIREQWGRLTDDEFDEIAGRHEQLVGRIQQRYGKARDEAEQEVNDFLDRMRVN